MNLIKPKCRNLCTSSDLTQTKFKEKMSFSGVKLAAKDMMRDENFQNDVKIVLIKLSAKEKVDYSKNKIFRVFFFAHLYNSCTLTK